LKNLILINGAMGVGKTATGRHLQKLLPNCIFLDGDWCWDSQPFIATAETKAMALRNIHFLLNSFLACSAYDNIIFCWVMHEESIINAVLSALVQDYQLFKFSLVCAESALLSRLEKDIALKIRTKDIVQRSISRLKNYQDMNTNKIDVSNITAEQAARMILENLPTQNPRRKR
jgi:ABC-type iron transport system FetAB ATPase subunit